jgi:predicted RNase H-like HicB family nuclease
MENEIDSTTVKQKLKYNFDNILNEIVIDDTLINHWIGIEVYADFLFTNLEHTFESICVAKDEGNIQEINRIQFPFRDFFWEFRIDVFNRDYEGKFTAYCPELIGCITEGPSKMEAFKNLCYAISETLVLNYDYLKINPITEKAKDIEITANIFIRSPDTLPYNYAKFLLGDAKYKQFYVSKKHLLVKNENFPNITLTMPNSGFQQLTEHLIKKAAGLE